MIPIEWKSVYNYRGLYTVSNTGIVRSLDRVVLTTCTHTSKCRCTKSKKIKGRVLKQSKIAKDKEYLFVTLYRDGVPDSKLVHRLVLEAFVSYESSIVECRHLDRNPTNNCLSNLCWGTRQENSDDVTLHGTRAEGEKHGGAKVTEEIVLEIRRLYNLSGGYRGAIRRISEALTVPYGIVRDIVRNVTWNHVKEAE